MHEHTHGSTILIYSRTQQFSCKRNQEELKYKKRKVNCLLAVKVIATLGVSSFIALPVMHIKPGTSCWTAAAHAKRRREGHRNQSDQDSALSHQHNPTKTVHEMFYAHKLPHQATTAMILCLREAAAAQQTVDVQLCYANVAMQVCESLFTDGSQSSVDR